LNEVVQMKINSMVAFAGLVLGGVLMCSTATAQVAPLLGQAGSFGVLGGSALTNTGPSVLFGDVGVSPGTAVSGFPPGVYSGILHVADAVALQAKSDLVTAYNVAAGQAFDADLTDQDLGGMVLGAGVYRFSTSAQLTGTLTLDAAGDPNAVFIFQIGSTLTTASNARVEVINGGAGCNVFWQVGSSATLGTTTRFVGNILALTSITLNTGASVAGRLLARNGAVTLDNNTVAACGSAPAASCPTLDLQPLTLPAGTLGMAYNRTVVASGGTGPYLYTVVAGSLPTGFALSAGGQLTGVPTATGVFAFSVRATDSNGCATTRAYSLQLAEVAAPAIIPVLPPFGLLLLAGLFAVAGWVGLRAR
jgi:hypothetical protein